MSKPVNVPLQGLRGIAALLVVADHAILRFSKQGNGFDWLSNYGGDLGAFGVQIFFCISGYIMVATTWDRFAQKGAPAAFVGARMRRIVPTYYIATGFALALLVFIAGQSVRWQSFVASVLFLPDPTSTGANMNPILNVGWSLNAEMFFYALFAAGLFFRRPVGLALTFAGVFGAIAIGVLSEKALGEKVWPPLLFYASRIMVMFPLGMALAIGEKQGWLPRIFQRVTSEFMVLCGVLLIIVFNLGMPGEYPLWRTALSFMVSAAAVLACINARRPAWLAKTEGFFDAIGDASYSVYLFHLLILMVCIPAFTALFGNANLWQIPVTGLIASAGAYGSYWIFERPIRKALSSKSAPSRTFKPVVEKAGDRKFPRMK